MSARTKARKRALDILYGAEVRQISVTESLADAATRAAAEPERRSSWVYARDIVEGVNDHADEIDEQIQTYAQGWTLSRMPHVDRAILRVAVWEILFNDDVPVGVAIDEAVESAKTLSTEESPRFVNGLLANIAQANAAS